MEKERKRVVEKDGKRNYKLEDYLAEEEQQQQRQQLEVCAKKGMRNVTYWMFGWADKR